MFLLKCLALKMKHMWHHIICVYIYYGDIIHQRCHQVYIYVYTPVNQLVYESYTLWVCMIYRACYYTLQWIHLVANIVIEESNFLSIQLQVQYWLVFRRLKFELINHMWQYSLITWPLQWIYLVILLLRNLIFFLCNKDRDKSILLLISPIVLSGNPFFLTYYAQDFAQSFPKLSWYLATL